jgi:hypothetical protein
MPGTYESIASQTLGSAAASITFSSIPATFTDLRLLLTFTSASGGTQGKIIFNGDTAVNYSRRELTGSGSAASSNSVQDQPQLLIGENRVVGSSTTIPQFSTMDIMQYKNTGMFKTCLMTNSNDLNGSGAVQAVVNLYRSTAAINSIVISTLSGTNLAIGTTAELIGISNA